MNKNNNKEQVVFKMKYATKLVQKGHKVLCQMPNPKNEKYTMWVFEVDDTFYDDFKTIKEEV